MALCVNEATWAARIYTTQRDATLPILNPLNQRVSGDRPVRLHSSVNYRVPKSTSKHTMFLAAACSRHCHQKAGGRTHGKLHAPFFAQPISRGTKDEALGRLAGRKGSAGFRPARREGGASSHQLLRACQSADSVPLNSTAYEPHVSASYAAVRVVVRGWPSTVAELFTVTCPRGRSATRVVNAWSAFLPESIEANVFVP